MSYEKCLSQPVSLSNEAFIRIITRDRRVSHFRESVCILGVSSKESGLIILAHTQGTVIFLLVSQIQKKPNPHHDPGSTSLAYRFRKPVRLRHKAYCTARSSRNSPPCPPHHSTACPHTNLTHDRPSDRSLKLSPRFKSLAHAPLSHSSQPPNHDLTWRYTGFLPLHCTSLQQAPVSWPRAQQHRSLTREKHCIVGLTQGHSDRESGSERERPLFARRMCFRYLR